MPFKRITLMFLVFAMQKHGFVSACRHFKRNELVTDTYGTAHTDKCVQNLTCIIYPGRLEIHWMKSQYEEVLGYEVEIKSGSQLFGRETFVNDSNISCSITYETNISKTHQLSVQQRVNQSDSYGTNTECKAATNVKVKTFDTPLCAEEVTTTEMKTNSVRNVDTVSTIEMERKKPDNHESKTEKHIGLLICICVLFLLFLSLTLIIALKRTKCRQKMPCNENTDTETKPAGGCVNKGLDNQPLSSRDGEQVNTEEDTYNHLWRYNKTRNAAIDKTYSHISSVGVMDIKECRMSNSREIVDVLSHSIPYGKQKIRSGTENTGNKTNVSLKSTTGDMVFGSQLPQHSDGHIDSGKESTKIFRITYNTYAKVTKGVEFMSKTQGNKTSLGKDEQYPVLAEDTQHKTRATNSDSDENARLFQDTEAYKLPDKILDSKSEYAVGVMNATGTRISHLNETVGLSEEVPQRDKIISSD